MVLLNAPQLRQMATAAYPIHKELSPRITTSHYNNFAEINSLEIFLAILWSLLPSMFPILWTL